MKKKKGIICKWKWKELPGRNAYTKQNIKQILTRGKKKKQHNTLHNNQVITPTRRQNNYKYI